MTTTYTISISKLDVSTGKFFVSIDDEDGKTISYKWLNSIELSNMLNLRVI